MAPTAWIQLGSLIVSAFAAIALLATVILWSHGPSIGHTVGSTNMTSLQKPGAAADAKKLPVDTPLDKRRRRRARRRGMRAGVVAAVAGTAYLVKRSGAQHQPYPPSTSV